MRNICFRIFFTSVLVGLSLFPSFLRARYGIHFFDEPYQILSGFDNTPNVLAPLSAKITHFFGEIFNWKWLYFRYLAISVNGICILSGGIFLYCKTHKYWISVIITCICLFLGTILQVEQNLYGWDRWSDLILIINIILFLVFSQSKKIYLLLIIGVLTGLSITIRLPNLVLIAVDIFCLLLLQSNCNIKFKYLYHSLFLIFTSLIFWAVGIYFSYGTVTDYFTGIFNLQVDDHESSQILFYYIWTLKRIVIFVIGFILTYHFLKFVRIKLGRFGFASFSLIIFSTALFISYYLSNRVFDLGLSMSIAIIWIIFGMVFWRSRKRFWSANNRECIILFIFTLIPTIGSNTGFFKEMVWPVIPILVYYFLPQYKRLYMPYIVLLILLLGSYDMLAIRRFSFFDLGFAHCPVHIQTGLAQGLYVSETNGSMINEIDVAMTPFNNNEHKIIVLRDNHDFIWEYLYKSPNSYLKDKFAHNKNDISNNYLNWIKEEIENSEKPVVVLYVFAWSADSEGEINQSLDSLLSSRLKTKTLNQRFKVYSPDS